MDNNKKQTSTEKYNQQDNSKMNLEALLEASLEKNLDKIKTLIEYGANVNSLLERGTSAPSTAGNSKELVEYTTPLALAVRNNSKEIVEYLLQNGADTEFTQGDMTLLSVASTSPQSIETVKLLIQYGAELNLTENLVTPLNAAMNFQPNNLEIFEVLIKNGARFTTDMNLDAYPLLSTQIVEFLRENVSPSNYLTNVRTEEINLNKLPENTRVDS